jgi:hypothetical protein
MNWLFSTRQPPATPPSIAAATSYASSHRTSQTLSIMGLFCGLGSSKRPTSTAPQPAKPSKGGSKRGERVDMGTQVRDDRTTLLAYYLRPALRLWKVPLVVLNWQQAHAMGEAQAGVVMAEVCMVVQEMEDVVDAELVRTSPVTVSCPSHSLTGKRYILKHLVIHTTRVLVPPTYWSMP